MNPGWWLLILCGVVLLGDILHGLIKGKSLKQIFFTDWF